MTTQPDRNTPTWEGFVPPLVRWVPDGEHAGVYVYVPLSGLWRRVNLDDGSASPLAEYPPAHDNSWKLFSFADVEPILDTYRSALEGALGSSREGPFDVDLVHDATEVVAAVRHSDLVSVVLAEYEVVPERDPDPAAEKWVAENPHHRGVVRAPVEETRDTPARGRMVTAREYLAELGATTPPNADKRSMEETRDDVGCAQEILQAQVDEHDPPN